MAINSRLLKELHVLKENFNIVISFFNYCMQDLHSGYLLMRTKNANAMYDLFVITALKS